MADKELRVKITGTAEKFQEALKQAENGINQLGRASLSSLSGGLLGGGLTGFVSGTVNAMMAVVTRIESVVQRAGALNISRDQVNRLDRFSSIAGQSFESGDQAVQTLRRARADALAGDDDAARLFERIGLALEEIKDLRPDELFDRVLGTATQAKLDAERFNSYAKLLGSGYASAVLPIASSPAAMKSVEEPQPWAGRKIDEFVMSLSGTDLEKLFKNAKRKEVRQLATPFEPFSDFGIRQREQAEFMAEQNRQRTEQVGRSMLTTEERINEVIAERLRISRLITEENDPIKRQKFIGDAIAVESEIAALTQKREGEITVKGSPRATDPLRQIGADFSRYGPSLTADIGKQQVTEIQRLRSSLESGLERVRAAIEREL
jgi:hypothetical protein